MLKPSPAIPGLDMLHNRGACPRCVAYIDISATGFDKALNLARRGFRYFRGWALLPSVISAMQEFISMVLRPGLPRKMVRVYTSKVPIPTRVSGVVALLWWRTVDMATHFAGYGNSNAIKRHAPVSVAAYIVGPKEALFSFVREHLLKEVSFHSSALHATRDGVSMALPSEPVTVAPPPSLCGPTAFWYRTNTHINLRTLVA